MNANKIIVLVPFYNASNYINACYQSLISQEYENYEIYFIDDCSSDNSLDLISDKFPKVIKRRNSVRLFALESIYNVLISREFNDEDIIVFVDGDDYLINNQVFKNLNTIYIDRNCLISYGQYITTDNVVGHCSAYIPTEFRFLRRLRWRASHLKSFKFKIFKEFLRQDPNVNAYKDSIGNFFMMTSDVALMTPLLEISGHHKVHFNREPLYVYRVHEFNDSTINIHLQRSIEEIIKNKPRFREVCFDLIPYNSEDCPTKELFSKIPK